MKPDKANRQNGFTLMAMMIIIAASSMVAVGGVTVLSRSKDIERHQVTEERLATIFEAIEQYATNNKRLPCPAALSDTPASASFAIEGDDLTLTDNCNAEIADVEYNSGADDVAVVGMVPTGTLGLHPRYALDGWNRKFTYAVDENLTVEATFATEHGDIQILDAAGDSVIGNATITAWPSSTPGVDFDKETQGAAVVVISHGPNSSGAYLAKSNATTTVTTSTYEEDNYPTSGMDGIFRITDFATVNPANYFDDIIDYRLRGQLDPLGEADTPPTCPAGLSGCVLWLDATDIDGDGNTGNNPADGDPIGTWVDKSGTGNDVTSSGLARPSYIATDSDLNNQPVLGFDRSEGDYLERTSPSQLNLDPAEDTFTLAVVYARTSSQSSNVKVLELEGEDSDPNRPEITMQLLGGSDVARIITNNKNYGADHGATDLDVPNVWIAHFNEGSSSSEYSFNDSGPLAFGGGIVDRSDNTNSVLCIGTGSIDSLICDQTIHALDGRIAEVIIINRGLSSSERTALKSYLDCKWRGVGC